MITKVLAGLVVLVLGWIGVLTLIMALSDEAPAALVPFPSRAFLDGLPEDVVVADRLWLGIVLTGEMPDFVPGLYAAGARLVLPAGLMGCAPEG